MSELQIPVYGEKSSEDLSNTMSCLTGSKSVTSTTSNSSIEFMDVDDHETSKGNSIKNICVHLLSLLTVVNTQWNFISQNFK